MTEQHTLSIIKPDATKKNVIGKIITIFEEAGLRVEAAKMMNLTKHQAESFYEIHKERPFFADLVKFMTSGPVFIQVLAGDDAVAKNRKLMGNEGKSTKMEGKSFMDQARLVSLVYPVTVGCPSQTTHSIFNTRPIQAPWSAAIL